MGVPMSKPVFSGLCSGIELLFVDEHVVVVNKPCGLLVHRGWGRDHDVALFRVRDAIGAHVFPVHRLDRGTSGALLFARSAEVAAALGISVQAGGLHRRYLALVRGVPPAAGVIDHPIPNDEGKGATRVPAVTHFRLIARSPVDRCALVEAIPRTGRLHQVRRHLRHLNHPLIGDVNYGSGEINRHYRAVYNLHRLALHAHQVAFDHPVTGMRVVVPALNVGRSGAAADRPWAAHPYRRRPSIGTPGGGGMSRRANGGVRCSRCRLHDSLCLCALIPRLETRTRLVLVIHRREDRKPTNTGRLATECLVNSEVIVRGDSGADPDAPSFWSPAAQPLLLFPDADAVPIVRFADSPRPVTLVVPDGTWRQASKVRQRIPWLRDVPAVCIEHDAPTSYRLRSEIREHGLATMEAIARSFGVLEGAPIRTALEGVLRLLVERTLWARGGIDKTAVFGGIPDGVVRHDPPQWRVPEPVPLNRQTPTKTGRRHRSAVSAVSRRLDGRDVDLPHRHHRFEGALCLRAAGCHGLGQRARGDLPGQPPAILAPTALAFLRRRCRRWRSSSGRSPPDCRWRSGKRTLRFV